MKDLTRNCCSVVTAIALAATFSACGYNLVQIENPDRDGMLMDLGHHFRIDLNESGKPVTVDVPVNPKRLRNTDIDTLTMVHHASDGKAGYTRAGRLHWSSNGKLTADISESGVYSLIAAPADALSRSLLTSYCRRREVPRVCQQIYCVDRFAGGILGYVPGVPPCELCARLQPGTVFAECLLDFREILYLPGVPSLALKGDDKEEAACKFRKVFHECHFRPQARDERQCMELAEQYHDVWIDDLTGQSCVCGTSARSITWAPSPNGCTDSIEGKPACMGWNWNCDVASE